MGNVQMTIILVITVEIVSIKEAHFCRFCTSIPYFISSLNRPTKEENQNKSLALSFFVKP